MNPLARTLEALLFLSPEPAPLAALAEAANVSAEDVTAALEELGAEYAPGERGLVLRELAGGWTLATAPEQEEAARRLLARPRTPPLTPAQSETLAIVAYLQPVSRPEITRIRGVAADSASGTLLERGMIEESGRSQFGAVLYRTTPLFLKLFGLNALSDLPDPSAWDPTPDEENDLRERLLGAGDVRAGRQGAPEQPVLSDGEPEPEPSRRVSDEPVRSVLYDVQAEQGAVFEDYDGWVWTLNLGDSLGEYEALRTDVVMWDVYGLVKWDVRGPDAVAAVQRVFTNAIGALQPGQVRYGAVVDASGSLVDDATVFRHAGDHLWVMTNGTTFADHLAGATPGMDVTVENRLHEMPLISVQGPRSRELLQGLTALDLSALPYFRFATDPVDVAGIPAYVLHTGFSGELGFELIPTERDNAPALWTALGEAGVRPIGFEAVEIARVEAGLIIHEQDYLAGEQTPYDVGLDRLVKLDEAEPFLGREALRAIAAAPPNRFVTLRLDGDELPELGADVLLDGEIVGCLTSPVESPRHGLIGLARVKTEAAADGARVEVAVGDETVPATVSHATAHDPQKLRVRS